MPGSGKYMRQPLFVEDFANVILSYVERTPENKIYNITGKEKILLIDMLKIYAKTEKKSVLFLKIPLPIFHLMIKVYGLINRKTRIVPEQLTALTAGDKFPVINWDKIFNVKPTKFKDGILKTVNAPYYKYKDEMKGEIL